MAIGCGAHRIRQFQEPIELDEGVAKSAGDRRAAGKILVDERLDHTLFELPLQIDDVIGNADVLGHAAGVVDIVERAAAAGGGFGSDFGQSPLIPELHGHPGDVGSLALEQGGDYGTIDAA